MFRILAVAALLSLTVSTVPAFAGDQTSKNLVWGENVSSGGKVGRGDAPLTPFADAPSRPAALPALYVSYAALQVYDVYSTRQALTQGAREANPFMQGVVKNQSGFWALKASTTIAAVAAAERLWKTNKTAAIAVMVASNGVAAVVAARNARVLRTQR
jgi:hypothetical protein